jgi:hypothetical protein
LTPAAIIRGAQSEGVRLAVSPAGTIKATGDGAAVSRWVAVIREHKAQIIDALKAAAHPAANDDAGLTASTANQWRVFDRDGATREITYSPARTEAQVRRDYPGCRAVVEVASTIAACALCKHATKYRNCGEPVRAGLTDRFEIVRHPAGGAGCAAYVPQSRSG